MWKRDESVKPATPTGTRAGGSGATRGVGARGIQRAAHQHIERDNVNIGKSVVIKGELSGSEDLTIEGHVEGRIELKENMLTIGPNGKIRPRCSPRRSSCSARSPATCTATREGGHPRQRLGGRRHHLAARGHCRGRALPRQRGHAARRRQAGGGQARGPAPAAAAQAGRAGRRPGGTAHGGRAAAARRSAPAAARTRWPIPLGTMTDLFALSGKPPRGRARARGGHPSAGAELSHPTKSLQKFLGLPAGARQPGADRPRSGRRQQRHLLRRAARAAASASRTSPPTSKRHVKKDNIDAAPGRSSRRGSSRRPAPSTASSAGTCSTISIGTPRRPWRPSLTHAAAARGGAARVLQHRPSRGTPVYTKYVVVDHQHLRYRPYPASRPRQRALLNGDIIRMFKGLRVSDSFLMKSNVREMLFRKNPARERRTPHGPSDCRPPDRFRHRAITTPAR